MKIFKSISNYRCGCHHNYAEDKKGRTVYMEGIVPPNSEPALFLSRDYCIDCFLYYWKIS